MPMEITYRSLNPPELVIAHRDHVRKLRDKNRSLLQRAFLSGNRQRLRVAKHKYFGNEANRAAYLYDAGLRFPTVRDWETEVALFGPLKPLTHAIDWWRLPKASGGVRCVCDLSSHMKAAHLMCADVIRAQFQIPCFVYNVKRSEFPAEGTGRNALVSKLLKQLKAGFTHYRVFDVRDCFSSINPDALTRLPLPRRVYENTLKLSNLCLRHDVIREQRHFADNTLLGNILHVGEGSGPTGLLQGSPASNIALAYLLQDLPQPCPDDGCILLFGDDLIALSRTAMIADRVDQKVTEFFEQPGLGPLHLHRRAAGNCGNFEYLGYEFAFSEITHAWHVGLSARNWDKLSRARNEEALKSWPLYGSWVDTHARHRIMKSLSGHPALSDAQSVCDALMSGGWDHVELAAEDHQRRHRSSP